MPFTCLPVASVANHRPACLSGLPSTGRPVARLTKHMLAMWSCLPSTCLPCCPNCQAPACRIVRPTNHIRVLCHCLPRGGQPFDRFTSHLPCFRWSPMASGIVAMLRGLTGQPITYSKCMTIPGQGSVAPCQQLASVHRQSCHHRPVGSCLPLASYLPQPTQPWQNCPLALS